MSAEEEFSANVQPIFFDYDKYDIRADAQATLSHDATYLVSHPNVKILIGGYFDEAARMSTTLRWVKTGQSPPRRGW